ncbi:DUF6053 domain-containing protein [Lysobacter enzymogenes]|uniref:DUF6053 domain-containing protein n=1 Tax=Lysobacter enzymogenes TaxID=69 RepID=UPI003D18D592
MRRSREHCCGRAFAGGPSGPTLLCRIAANRPESVGPEDPPTKAAAHKEAALAKAGSRYRAPSQ